MPKLRILLVNTKVPRSTKKMVEGVRRRHDKVGGGGGGGGYGLWMVNALFLECAACKLCGPISSFQR